MQIMPPPPPLEDREVDLPLLREQRQGKHKICVISMMVLAGYEGVFLHVCESRRWPQAPFTFVGVVDGGFIWGYYI